MGIIADLVAKIKLARDKNIPHPGDKNMFLLLAGSAFGGLVEPLERTLAEKGFEMQTLLGAGSSAIVGMDAQGDIVRVANRTITTDYDSLDSGIAVKPAAAELFPVANPGNPALTHTFSAQLRPRGVSECKAAAQWQARSINKDDMLTVAAILHHRKELSHWIDMPIDTSTDALEISADKAARDKLMYLSDGKGDVLRFSNRRPIPFLVDTNSLVADAHIAEVAASGVESDNSTARNYLKQVYGCDSEAALDALLEKRLAELPSDWEASLKQQDQLLDGIRERHGLAPANWTDRRPAEGRPGPAALRTGSTSRGA